MRDETGDKREGGLEFDFDDLNLLGFTFPLIGFWGFQGFYMVGADPSHIPTFFFPTHTPLLMLTHPTLRLSLKKDHYFSR